MSYIRLPIVALLLLLGACAADTGGEPEVSGENAVVVDTHDPLAKAQYDANAAFVRSYAAKCAPSATSNRPRVLVTGFGRFMSVASNATGHIVNALVPAAAYPETAPPAAGEVDPPAPQTSVAQALV